MNIFKINKKINDVVNAIDDFNPDILFSVDSPDFTLRVIEKVKKKKNNIKTIHYVAPQVWVWREGRVKKIKKFIDHILLLFNFEKAYFEKEQVSCEFVGHPLLEKRNISKIDINQITGKNKALISIFPGSRTAEIITLMPILLNFINLMERNYKDITYVFHSTRANSDLIKSYILSSGIKNCEIISDDKIKSHILSRSIFAVSKSGTVSLEICNAKIPSIIIYKIGLINFLIVKMLAKIKYANIINIIANEEIIPELLQSKCNSDNIYNYVNKFLDNPDKIKDQITRIEKILNKLKTKKTVNPIATILK